MELDEWVHSVFWLSYHCIKCTGLTKKIHFTFESSQEKLHHHRLSTALLRSQQLPSWFPAPELLLQTRKPPRHYASAAYSYGQYYSGCLSPSSLQIRPPPSSLTVCLILQDHSYLHRFLPLCKEHRDHLSWFLIGPEMCLADLHGLSNCDHGWTNHLTSLCLSLLICKMEVINSPRLLRGLHESICGAFRSPLPGSL